MKCGCWHVCSQKAETHNKVLDGGIADEERKQMDEQIAKLQQLLESSSNRSNDLEDALETQLVRERVRIRASLLPCARMHSLRRASRRTRWLLPRDSSAWLQALMSMHDLQVQAQHEEETHRRQKAESEAAAAVGRMRVLEDALQKVPATVPRVSSLRL